MTNNFNYIEDQVSTSQKSSFSSTTEPITDREEEKLVDKFEDANIEGFALNTIEKNGDTIRKKYLYTLCKMKLWVSPSEKPTTHQTGINL